MSGAFAITFGAGLFLAVNVAPVQPSKGWTPYRWTRDRHVAELFSTEAKAHAFAVEQLKHDRYRVVAIPPSNRLPPHDGGTPHLARIEAA